MLTHKQGIMPEGVNVAVHKCSVFIKLISCIVVTSCHIKINLYQNHSSDNNEYSFG